MEEENLNTGNSDDSKTNETSNPIDNSQKWEETSVDYKTKYTESSKEAHRLVEEKKTLEYDKLINSSFRQVLKDNSYLLELDPDIAKDVVKQLHEDWYADTDSYEELLESINQAKSSNDPIDEKELAKKVRAEIEQETKAEQAKKLLDERLAKFDTDTKAKYLEEFKEVMWNKKLTPELAQREIDKIITYYNRDEFKKAKQDEELSKLASNPINSNAKTENKTTITREKLAEMWVPLANQKILYPELFTN